VGIWNSIKRGAKLTGKSFGEGVDFAEKNFVKVVKYFLAGMGAIILGMVIGSIILLLPFFFEMEQVFRIICFLLAVVAVFVGFGYSFAAYLGATQFIYHGKKVGYFESGNLMLSLKWVLLVGVLITAFFAGLYGLVILTSEVWEGFADATGAAGAFGALLLVLLGMIFTVISYYSAQEIALKKKGPFAAIEGSFSIVKKRFWETVLFSTFLSILLAVIEIIWRVAMYVAILIGFLFALLISPWLLIPVAIITLIVSLLIWSAIGAGELIVRVEFYQKITKPKMKKAA